MPTTLLTIVALLLTGTLAFAAEPSTGVDGERKRVALCFDDGPFPGDTPEILAILDKHDVKATFNVVVRRLREHPEITKDALSRGHEIANHSMDHPKMLDLESQSEVDHQIINAQKEIVELLGVTPRFYWAPHVKYDDRALDASKRAGLETVFQYDFGVATSRDTAQGVSEQDIFDKIFAGGTQPEMMLYMHDMIDNSRAVLPRVIEEFKSRGYEFVTLSELADGVEKLHDEPAMRR